VPDLIRSRCDIVGRGEWEYRHLGERIRMIQSHLVGSYQGNFRSYRTKRVIWHLDRL